MIHEVDYSTKLLCQRGGSRRDLVSGGQFLFIFGHRLTAA